MRNRYLLLAFMLLTCMGAQAQLSRLTGLTKTRFATSDSAFNLVDSAYYMYSGARDTTNGGALAYDSSYTLAYAPGATINGYSYRYYQQFDGSNNDTATLTQVYDLLPRAG